MRVRQKREIDPSWRIKSVTVEHTRSGRFEVSVLFEFETQEPEQVEPESFVGLDYSSHDLYVTSDGERPGYPRYFRHAERKLAREQRKLSRMQKGSANWRKQKLRVARVHEKMKNQRKDFHHKAANGLVERYDCVCVEDLDMRGMSRSLKLGKSTMDNGFGMFRALLGYKLEDRGKRLAPSVGCSRRASSVMSAATASREPRTCRLGSGRAPCAVAPMTATLTLLGTSGTKV